MKFFRITSVQNHMERVRGMIAVSFENYSVNFPVQIAMLLCNTSVVKSVEKVSTTLENGEELF